MPILFLFWLAIFFLLSKLIRQYHRKELSTQEFLAWSFFWASAGGASFFVRALDPWAKRFGVERAIDLGVYVAIAILFFALYRIFVRLLRMEKDITFLVREEALKSESYEKGRDHHSHL